ncbi:MAG TPA: immunoglobulin domain-containing protein [Phycisphaerales bacterium]|nr:immunoglobulin domain-containing protein [Phycisphaerales bacterium]
MHHRYLAVASSFLTAAHCALAQSCVTIQPAPFAHANGVDGQAVAEVQPRIYAAVVHDFDGDGPQPERLIVSGTFVQMGGAPANGIAAFDGERWHPLARGLNLTSSPSSLNGGLDLLVHNNELYVGGLFSGVYTPVPSAGGYSNSLAKWNGMTWEPIYTRFTLFNGEIWDLETLNGEVYAAGQGWVGGQTGLPNVGVIRPDRLLQLPLGGFYEPVVGLTRIGSELVFGLTQRAVAWNGTSARTFPRPQTDGRLFPTAGIELSSGTILAGEILAPASDGRYAATSFFDGNTHTLLPGLSHISGFEISSPRTVWRFTSFNGVVRAWGARDPRYFPPPIARFENGQWIVESQPILNSLDQLHRGDVRFQNRRYLYGNTIAGFGANLGPNVSSDPYRALIGATEENAFFPLDGVYPITPGSSSVLATTTRAITRMGSDIVFGGPLQFVANNQTINFIAKWDGVRWSRVANNDLAFPPAAALTVNNTLYAIAPFTSQGSMQVLRVENNVWTPVPGASIPYDYRNRLDVHNNEPWVILPGATGGTSRLYRVTQTGLVAAPTTGLPTLSTSRLHSVGNDLYLSTLTALFKLTGTSWASVPLTGGPANVANTVVVNGSLYVVSPASLSGPVQVHRLDGNTWTLVATAPSNFVISGVSELDGLVHIVGRQPGTGLATFNPSDGSWTTLNWPDAAGIGNAFTVGSQYPSSGGENVEARVMKDAAGRTLMLGAFNRVGITLTQGIAVVQQAQINVHWPPLPRLTTRNSTVSIGVGATGPKNHDGDLTYQWLRNDQPLMNGVTPNGSTISGATTRRLQLTLAQVEDAGMYSVRISLPCGVTTTTTPVPITVSICNDIDFNNNGLWPENQDADDFINVFAGASCPACDDVDFNNNGVFPEDNDIIDFFTVFAGGNC